MRTLVLALIVSSAPVWAQSGGSSSTSSSSATGSHGLAETLYVDVYGFWDSSTGNVAGQSGSASLNQEGLGFTIAPMWSGFFAGLGTDYRMINNSSTPNTQLGSFKGTRWAPLVLATGYVSDTFVMKAEYEPQGELHLSQSTYQGSSITYGAGGGFRVTFLYGVIANVMVGPSYEQLQFSAKTDSQTGTNSNAALTLRQFGLIGAYVF